MKIISDKIVSFDNSKPPIKEDEDLGVMIDLMQPLWMVMYEGGYITWDEYAKLVPRENRPRKYRDKPKHR